MANGGHDLPLTIVVAYRSEDQLQELFRAGTGLANVVVIDNSASAETAAVTHAARATYLESPGNVGFAAAVNLAIEKFWNGRQDVLLLNPDARLTGAQLAQLQAFLHANPRAAAVGPALTDEHGRPQAATWPMPSPASVWLDALGLADRWRGARFVVGAVLLLRAEALAELGGLDEGYFLYAEETDWQMRAIRAGWVVRATEHVTAVHVGAASSSNAAVREALFYESADRFARRWYGPFGLAAMRLGSIVAALRRSPVGPADARAANRRALRQYLRLAFRRRPPEPSRQR